MIYNRIRVLIVEDDTLVGEMLKGILEEIGYTVIGKAVNGREAIEMVQSLLPDVVLMDIEMPDMDGIEATRQILNWHPVPVVMVTAHETPELVHRASKAGVGAYLVKPPDTREVERAITIAMARFDDMMELRRLNTELVIRNEELDAFAHTVAHDLQSPLGLIVGYAEVLSQDHKSLSDSELETYLQTIMNNGRKVSNIVDALLLLAGVRNRRVESGPLNMARILSEVQKRVAPMVAEYQAEVILSDDWPAALGYASWIEEVWVNYISNAIKYGGSPPRIELGANPPVDGMVWFWVQDNGAGLSAAEQQRLFTPFTRLDQARVKGYGLGLSIVRRIVEKLGGSVKVESNGIDGQGSRFLFSLPQVDA
jgi:two-component system sensor histidine kinase/response regulator